MTVALFVAKKGTFENGKLWVPYTQALLYEHIFSHWGRKDLVPASTIISLALTSEGIQELLCSQDWGQAA